MVRSLQDSEVQRVSLAVNDLSAFIRAQMDHPVSLDYINWRALHGDIAIITSALQIVGVLPERQRPDERE